MWGWMPEIDHEPREKRPTWTIWWIAWGLIVAGFVHQAYFGTFDWEQIALGAFAGMVLAAWAIEITGNKVPDSWRGKRRR